jgi:alkylhydroperoxidase/carboxymuconolactone decarboxylase family protein YurZ
MSPRTDAIAQHAGVTEADLRGLAAVLRRRVGGSTAERATEILDRVLAGRSGGRG